jgi:hypothetical protein
MKPRGDAPISLLVVAVTELPCRFCLCPDHRYRNVQSKGTEIRGFNQPGSGVNRYFLDSMRVNVAKPLRHLESALPRDAIAIELARQTR